MRHRITPRVGRIAAPDVGLVILTLLTVFLLLVSPIIPYEFSFVQLLVWTVVVSVPVAAVGIYLNHRAERG